MPLTLFSRPRLVCGEVAFLGILLYVVLNGSGAQAAEWSKMKTCSDLGFCRRHRTSEAQSSRLRYTVQPGSVHIAEWRGSSALVGNLLRGAETDPLLMFAITSIRGGVYRIVVEDAITPLHERYVVKDVLVEDATPTVISEDQVEFSTYGAVVSAAGRDGPRVAVSLDPFKVELYAGGSDASPAVVFNGKSLLQFETHIAKAAPSPSPSPSPSPQSSGSADGDTGKSEDNSSPALPTGAKTGADEDGLWEESFQSHHDPKTRGPESVGGDISFPFADHLYGLPERTTRLSLPYTIAANGSAASEPYRLYNLDVFEFELHKPLGLYGAIPFIVARRGASAAGALWLNSAETYVDVFEQENSAGRTTHWYSETGRIDLFMVPGPTAGDVYQKYLFLTGAPAMPQRFALGYHQCRWNYRDDGDARTVDGEFDKHEIPYDVLWLDIEHTDGKRYFTWDMGKFPDPTKLQNDIAERGRKMVTIIDPHIKRDTNYAVHRDAENNGYYVKTPEGKSYEGWCWPGSSSYYDFTSPVARAAWASRFNPKDYPHFSNNLYTWVDMNEPSVFNGPEGTMPKHMVHANNVQHRDVHNQYGFYVQQATFEGLLRGHGGNDRPFVLSRSFFAGSQRFGAVWTGDNTAAWDHLETSARMILPLQLSGMVFSGADVGGFFGNPSPELLVRWYQAAAFQPFFRGHAHLDTNRREPWLFGDENTLLIREAVRTRYSYLPLWYTLMAANALKGKSSFISTGSGPPMRPLWWEFPEDDRLDDMEDQWMVGSSLLAAPVLKEGAKQRTVYLPGAGPWYDLHAPEGLSAARIDPPTDGSGREVTVGTPMSRLLVYQRGGTIVPKQERVRRSTRAMAGDPYTLVVALDSSCKAEGELYMDDGHSFDFTRGAHVLRRFSYSDGRLSAKTVFGSAESGSFVGVDSHVERVVVMGIELAGKASASVLDEHGAERELHVVHDREARVAIIRQPRVLAARGEWHVDIRSS